MLKHRFRMPKPEQEDEFFLALERGTFRGLFRSIWGKILCVFRIHEGGLHADKWGFFKICDRCMHYERIEFWYDDGRK